MLLKLRQSLMRPGRLHRAVAIFFLIFTFTDLVVADMLAPQLCSEAAAGLPLGVANIDEPEITSTKETGCSVSSERHSSERPAEPSDFDEDCFCCCSHIIPSVCISVAVLNSSPQPSDPTITSLPSSPLRDTFHPPRLS